MLFVVDFLSSLLWQIQFLQQTLKYFSFLQLQAGDGYLAGLAARFSSELHLDEEDVLHQLEDLRSVATSDCWTTTRSRRLSDTEPHNYANYPTSSGSASHHSDDKNFLPGIYAVSFYEHLLDQQLKN